MSLFSFYYTWMAVRSIKSGGTETTITFTCESSLARALVQTWAATARILLTEKLKKATNLKLLPDQNLLQKIVVLSPDKYGSK